jgi:hypothetical protein
MTTYAAVRLRVLSVCGNTDLGNTRIETNYPQKLWISRGLTNVEGNDWSRLEVDWLFFAQDHPLTDSVYSVSNDKLIKPM